MFKIIPLVAYGVGFYFAAKSLTEIHEKLIEGIKVNNFKKMELCHHLSSGFKAFFTSITYDGLDTLRMACGGAGFSAHSGLPAMLQDYAPFTTFEGDNTVMAQQAARFLLKNIKNVKER